MNKTDQVTINANGGKSIYNVFAKLMCLKVPQKNGKGQILPNSCTPEDTLCSQPSAFRGVTYFSIPNLKNKPSEAKTEVLALS